MFVAVAALRVYLGQHHVPGSLSLTAQVVCGAVVYFGAAFVLAGANVRELIRVVRPAPSPA
jgi:hypothetical protein